MRKGDTDNRNANRDTPRTETDRRSQNRAADSTDRCTAAPRAWPPLVEVETAVEREDAARLSATDAALAVFAIGAKTNAAALWSSAPLTPRAPSLRRRR